MSLVYQAITAIILVVIVVSASIMLMNYYLSETRTSGKDIVLAILYSKESPRQVVTTSAISLQQLKCYWRIDVNYKGNLFKINGANILVPVDCIVAKGHDISLADGKVSNNTLVSIPGKINSYDLVVGGLKLAKSGCEIRLNIFNLSVLRVKGTEKVAAKLLGPLTIELHFSGATLYKRVALSWPWTTNVYFNISAVLLIGNSSYAKYLNTVGTRFNNLNISCNEKVYYIAIYVSNYMLIIR